MNRIRILLLLTALYPLIGSAEILAMLNYESKPNVTPRKEGIAIIDVDPASANFAKIVTDIPLPADLVAHHLFYNQDAGKLYVTALGNGPLHVIDMRQAPPYTLKKIDIPQCRVSEDIIFSEDNKTWYLTCMGSSNVIVGDAQTDRAVKTLTTPPASPLSIRHPHGIGLHEGIDRLLVTSTVRPSDLGDAGENVTVIEASSGKVLSSHKVSNGPDAVGAAPVEVVFLPGANPPLAYINNMFSGTLWTAIWQADRKAFHFQQAYDFNGIQQGVPLEIYFNADRNRLYVTTAKPGNFNVFDISRSAAQPTLIKSIPAAAGAHHVAFSPDERYAFVQNSLLNLPDMNDGSITVLDLKKLEPIAHIDTLKNQGLAPNSIVLMPQWHRKTD